MPTPVRMIQPSQSQSSGLVNLPNDALMKINQSYLEHLVPAGGLQMHNVKGDMVESSYLELPEWVVGPTSV